MDAEMMGAAIRDFYTGKSYKQIAEGLKDEYDIPEPSKATIYEWVKDYTDEAKEQTADLKAEVGDEWAADEIAVKVWQLAVGSSGIGTSWIPRLATSSLLTCPAAARRRPPCTSSLKG